MSRDVPQPKGRPAGQKWQRTKGAPFDDLQREDFAKARAKGGSIKAAGNVAGVKYETAMTWQKHPDMMARIRELRGNAEDFLGVSLGWVIHELKLNVEAAREAEHYKSSNEALMLIHKIITTDKTAAHNMAQALPAASGQDLQRALKASFGGSEPITRRMKKGRRREHVPHAVVDTTGTDASEGEAAE